MNTGLEHATDKTLEKIVSNLKSGVFEVVNMGKAAHVAQGKHECPPVAAFETNMMILQAFQAECLRRGMDYDGIAPNIREIEDMWLEARQ